MSLLLEAVTETKPVVTAEADEPEAKVSVPEAETSVEAETSLEAETSVEAEISVEAETSPKAEFPIEDSDTATVCRHSCARLSMLSLDAMC